MSSNLNEIPSDWHSINRYIPGCEGYYEVSACDDEENIIKSIVANWRDAFYFIDTLKSKGNEIKNVKFWRNLKHK